MDIEQPRPAALDEDAPEPEVTEPEWLDFEIEQAAHDAARVAAFFGVLTDDGMAGKRAERLTREWMAYRLIEDGE